MFFTDRDFTFVIYAAQTGYTKLHKLKPSIKTFNDSHPKTVLNGFCTVYECFSLILSCLSELLVCVYLHFLHAQTFQIIWIFYASFSRIPDREKTKCVTYQIYTTDINSHFYSCI